MSHLVQYPGYHGDLFQRASLALSTTKVLILSMGYPLSYVVKCWCGTIAAEFSQVAQRHSDALCRFPSWMYLLGGDDSCMLSVPSSTCHSRNCCWQRGETYQAIADAAFTLVFPHCRLLPIEDDLLFALPCYLPTCHLFCDSRLLGLTLRHYALSFVVTGFLGHAGGWHLRRKPCVFPSSLFSRFFCSCLFLQGHSGSPRANSRQAALKCEGFAIT